MKDTEKPTHLKPYKCRKCKSIEYKWVRRYNNEHYWTRSCVTCRNISEAKSIKKLKEKDYYSKWQKDNKQHLRDYQNKHYKGKHKGRNGIYARRLRERTLPNENMFIIREFYSKCPNGYEVDHIIPLNGKHVSGLHTIGNLQYLPASKNRSKSNRIL